MIQMLMHPLPEDSVKVSNRAESLLSAPMFINYNSKTYLVLGYAGQHIPEFLKDDAFYKFDWDLQQQVLQKNEPVVSFDPNEVW